MESCIGVFAESPTDAGAAAILAAELNLPLAADSADARFTHLLVLTLERLELREVGVGASGPVYVNFLGGAVAHRRRFGGGRRQPLARAMGMKGDNALTVLDVTAGLGRDAFVLVCLGCVVELVERSPIVAALLRDGLARAVQDPEIGPLIAARLHLTMADGRDSMRRLAGDRRPDVIYLDPMYPHRQKSALVKKEMRMLRRVVGDDLDAPALLAEALECARRRVVVKRPRLAPPLSGPPPTVQIVATNTRFDVYLLNRVPPA